MISPDEKAVLDALKRVDCAPFTEFSRLCAERDRLLAENERLRAAAAKDPS